jgi:hypothetical protein
LLFLLIIIIIIIIKLDEFINLFKFSRPRQISQKKIDEINQLLWKYGVSENSEALPHIQLGDSISLPPNYNNNNQSCLAHPVKFDNSLK